MPLVLAHRGANKVAPQNTIPAFQRSIEFLADGIETDVHLCLDNEIVICHNYTIDDTSNGVGRIDEMTLEELKRYDFGSYFNKNFAGVSLPTLNELLDVVKDMALINIEIKKVVEKIHEYGIVGNSIVSCFDPECVRQVKEFDKNIQTALLYEGNDLGKEIMSFGVAKYCKQLGVDAAHPEYFLISHKEVMELHNSGIKVNPWTVNEKEDIVKLTNWGCDALITDVPDFCRKVLEKM